jgi:glycosyltransferase involved in cell wall biosynthesis
LNIVSVVLTSYNSELYIRDQIDSILNQSYVKFELLIVDDFSQDNTRNIICEYAEKDPRVNFLFNEKNCGCTASFSKGIENSKGEFILLSDHDDVWQENKIECLLTEINDAVLVYSDCNIIDSSGIVTSNSYKEQNKLIGMDSSNKNIIPICAFNSFILGCSIMFQRQLVDYILPITDDSYNHDKWIVFIASCVGKIKFIDEKLFSYRVHGNNLSKNSNVKEANKFFIDSNLTKPIFFRIENIEKLKKRLVSNSKSVDVFFKKYNSGKKNQVLFYFFGSMFKRYSGLERFKRFFNWYLREKTNEL